MGAVVFDPTGTPTWTQQFEVGDNSDVSWNVDEINAVAQLNGTSEVPGVFIAKADWRYTGLDAPAGRKVVMQGTYIFEQVGGTDLDDLCIMDLEDQATVNEQGVRLIVRSGNILEVQRKMVNAGSWEQKGTPVALVVDGATPNVIRWEVDVHHDPAKGRVRLWLNGRLIIDGRGQTLAEEGGNANKFEMGITAWSQTSAVGMNVTSILATVTDTEAVITADRTALPWPDPVFLHADASTLGAGSRQTASYLWTLSDGRTFRGPNVSFWADAAVDVTLRVTDDVGGEHTSAATSITVAAPAFSRDYHVSAAGNDTTGDGSVGAPWATFAKAISELDANWVENGRHRINLRRGDTFQTTTGWSENSHQGKFMLAAYGSGADPILEYTGTGSFFSFDTGPALHVEGVHIRGQYNSATNSGNAPAALLHVLGNGSRIGTRPDYKYRLTVRNAELSGANVSVITDTYNIAWVGDTSDPLTSWQTNLTGATFFEDVHVHDCKTNNVYMAKSLWLGIHGTVIEHCREGHVLRLAGAKFFDIRDTDLFDPAFAAASAGASRHCLKMHAEVDSTNRFNTRFGYISNLRVRGGHWGVMIAPQDAGKDEWGSDIVIDGVQSLPIVASSGIVPTGRLFTIAWPRVTVRNVLAVLDPTSTDPAVVFHAKYTSITGENPGDLLLENISGYHGGGGTTSAALLETALTFAPGGVEAAATEGDVTGGRLRNCAFKQTGTGTGRAAVFVRGGAVGVALSEVDHNCYDLAQARQALVGATPHADLAAWQTASGMEANSIEDDPGYLDAANGDLHIDAGSPLIGAGHDYGSNRYDVDGEERTGTALATIGADALEAAQTVALEGIAASVAVGQPTLTPGAVTVAIASTAAPVTVGQPAVAPQSVTATLSGVAVPVALGEPSLTVGAALVALEGVGVAAAVGQPTVTTGGISVVMQGVAVAVDVGSPAVVPGTVTVSLQGLGSGLAIGQPAVFVGTVVLVGVSCAVAVGLPAVTVGASYIPQVGVDAVIAVGPGGAAVRSTTARPVPVAGSVEATIATDTVAGEAEATIG